MKPAATFEATDQLGEIVIDNPPLNLFSERLIADLRAAAQQAAASDARAVAAPSRGRRVLGRRRRLDLQRDSTRPQAEELMTRALSLIAAIEDIPVPTVALVHGRCFAGALEVALACDLIWAAAGTQIGQVEAVIGAFPFAGGRSASRRGSAPPGPLRWCTPRAFTPPRSSRPGDS